MKTLSAIHFSVILPIAIISLLCSCIKDPLYTYSAQVCIDGTEYSIDTRQGASNSFKETEDGFTLNYTRWISEDPYIQISIKVSSSQAMKTGVRYDLKSDRDKSDPENFAYVDYLFGHRYIATDGWLELTSNVIEFSSEYDETRRISGKYEFTAFDSITGKTIHVTNGSFKEDIFTYSK